MKPAAAPVLAGMADDWRVNNFDLIRLFAALQVALVHTRANLQPPGLGVAILDAGLRMFPGVPIFFLISGFLISKSFERSGSIRDYYRNRCLRIFPGLWVCLVASIGVILMMLAKGGIAGAVSSRDWLIWWAAQMSLFQQYAPNFLDGVRLNGSLWTIPVELEFYLLLPLLYAMFHLRKRGGDAPLCGVLAGSLAVHWAFIHEAPGSWLARHDFLLDTAVPYLWMFVGGTLLQRNWSAVRGWLAGRAHWWLLGYVLLCSVCRQVLHVGVGSADISPVFLLPLAATVMSCAVSAPALSERILGGNDISYGTYIYHMLVVAVILQFGGRGDILWAAAAVVISAGLGTLSWYYIEKPFLRHKHYALRRIREAPVRSSRLHNWASLRRSAK